MLSKKIYISKAEEIDISSAVYIQDIHLLDGGRTSLYCDNNGKKFWIRLVTNGFMDKPYPASHWPGGLYINSRLVKIDSPEEKLIVEVLKALLPPKEWYDNQMESDGKLTTEGKLTENLIQFLTDFILSPKYQELGIITGRIIEQSTTKAKTN